jgi:hypothetical protein
LFEGLCIFGYREFYKNLLCILMEVNKTIYRIMKMFQKTLEHFPFE